MVQTALFIIQVSGPWTSLPQEQGDESRLVPRLAFRSLFPLENIEEHLHNGTLWIDVSLHTSCREHDKASFGRRDFCSVQGYSQRLWQ